MDNIEMLLKQLKDIKAVAETRFNSSFLNNVADVFERYGFGTTKAFLIDKKSRRDLKYQAFALMEVIKKFEEFDEIKSNRSIGRYIIKTLITLKRTEI